MGLKNYDEQLNNLKSCEKQIRLLQSYGNSMGALVISLQSIWSLNIDFSKVNAAINVCTKWANAIIEDYSAYEKEALDYLNKMNLLEDIKHWFPKASKAEKAFQMGKQNWNSSSRSTRISVNTQGFFDEFRGQLNAYKEDLEDIKNATIRINSRIDSEIKKQFKSDGDKLAKIAVYIDRLCEKTNNIALALILVEQIYEKNETNLEQMAMQLTLKGDSSGTVDGTVNKSFEKYKSGVKQGNWPEAKYYSLIDANAAYLSQYDRNSGWGKGDCNVTSHAMLLRRKAMSDGKDYTHITANSIRGNAANGGQAVNYHYKYEEYSVSRQGFDSNASGAQKAEKIQELLEAHPEGIVVWGNNSLKKGGAHAIIITRYDPISKHFYCCDPAGEHREILLSESLVRASDSDLSCFTQYYCVNQS